MTTRFVIRFDTTAGPMWLGPAGNWIVEPLDAAAFYFWDNANIRAQRVGSCARVVCRAPSRIAV